MTDNTRARVVAISGILAFFALLTIIVYELDILPNSPVDTFKKVETDTEKTKGKEAREDKRAAYFLYMLGLTRPK